MKEEISKETLENDAVKKKWDLEKKMKKEIYQTNIFPKTEQEVAKRTYSYFDISAYDEKVKIHEHIDKIGFFGWPDKWHSTIKEIAVIDYVNKEIIVSDERFYDKLKEYGSKNKYIKIIKNWNGASLKKSEDLDE